MRGRPLVAALVASVACFAALGASVAVAQTQSVDPQQAKTETAAESPPDLLSGEPPDFVAKAPEQPAAAPQEVAPTPNASPVVASIRAKLADLRKSSSSSEVIALEEFYNGRDDALWMTDMGFSGEALAAIDEMLRADDWGLSSAAFELPPAGALPKSPDEAAANEIKLDLAILKYARYARGGRTDPAKLNKLFGVAPTLPDPDKVLTELAGAEAPDAYLRSLHPKHEQFQRLHQALLKARAESDAGAKTNTQKIVVNMERWRWMPEDLGSLHLWLNVPEFTVYVFKDGKSIYSDKIVVGELKYATPMFSADLKSIVFNPEWTVPPTIVRENLLPNLRRRRLVRRRQYRDPRSARAEGEVQRQAGRPGQHRLEKRQYGRDQFRAGAWAKQRARQGEVRLSEPVHRLHARHHQAWAIRQGQPRRRA